MSLDGLVASRLSANMSMRIYVEREREIYLIYNFFVYVCLSILHIGIYIYICVCVCQVLTGSSKEFNILNVRLFCSSCSHKIKRLQSKRKLDSDLASFHTFGNAGVDRLSPIFGPFSIHAWQWTRVRSGAFTSQAILGIYTLRVRGIMFVKETFQEPSARA